MLGGFIALLSAATFAFNNASVRRGVLTGSVLQAMAITVPIGLPISFLVALATGSLAARGRLFLARARGALALRRHAFRVGSLLQLSRNAGDRHQSGGADPADQSHLHAAAGDLDPGRDADAVAHARDRPGAAGAELHAARSATPSADSRARAGPRRRRHQPGYRGQRGRRSHRRRAGRVPAAAMRKAISGRCCRRPAMA